MRNTIRTDIATFSVVVLLTALPAVAQDAPKPKYAADVPEFLLTPDQVETEFLGDLDFFDGMPSESTVQKTYDFLDLSPLAAHARVCKRWRLGGIDKRT